MQHSYVLHWWRIVCHVNIFSEILYKSLLFFNVHKVCANVLRHWGHLNNYPVSFPLTPKHKYLSFLRIFIFEALSSLEIIRTNLSSNIHTNLMHFGVLHFVLRSYMKKFNLLIWRRVWQNLHAGLSCLIPSRLCWRKRGVKMMWSVVSKVRVSMQFRDQSSSLFKRKQKKLPQCLQICMLPWCIFQCYE